MARFTQTILSSVITLGLTSGGAIAQQVFVTDVIVQGSLCVGIDCTSGMNFGFDTEVLKENNLRLFFDDTSNSASFPNNDWRLIANESTNGGANMFAIEDATAGRNVFTIEAGARANQLYVDSTNRVGFGTNAPVVDLHVKQGNTPTLRLDQDGSSGFTAQTWDIAGNEANFFIRDVTGGSDLVFRIKPGAPEDSIYIDSDNQIGMGTDAPQASLHLRRTDGTAKLKVEELSTTSAARTVAEFVNNGRPDLVLANTSQGNEWSIGGGTNMVLKSGAVGSLPSAKTTQLTLTNSGNMTITGTLTTGGTTCGGGCDLVFTDQYDLPSIEQHSERMYALGHLPNVGPTIENQPINLSDKLGRMLNELEHAHIYIDQLHQENRAQRDAIAALTARLDTLENTAGE
ncbi:hypothetical protein [Marimonas arenosa]|uniref:Uncharacterized protein n=1 Tax=Marimonas arenosa TaxID=1795305 RepID=A0AAE3WCM6_9RHOB|nr:hypothetical protein [Marimonas arenosa]MDQ2090267.1 hypothetical protein [Marimonas arenosa]